MRSPEDPDPRRSTNGPGPGDYDRRPWLVHYAPDLGAHLTLGAANALQMFEATVADRPNDNALEYLGQTMTWREVDEAADAVAGLLVARGFAPGDRLAMLLQNDPAFVICLVAAWRAGGSAALISPMVTADELRQRLHDHMPTALVALDDLYLDVVSPLLADGTCSVRVVITTSPLDGPSGPVDEPRLFTEAARRSVADAVDLRTLISNGQARQGFAPRPIGPRDIAVVMATSGTTGPPKGACLTHANVVFSAHVYRRWCALGAEPILGASPLFHVTGLIGAAALSMLTGSPLVLTHRFRADVVLDAIRRTRPRFMVAVITAYIALANEPDLLPTDLDSLELRLSGGAPIDPAICSRLQDRLGGYIHNVYGLTETSSPSHMVPIGAQAPVDSETGVLSVGVPVFDTIVRVVGDDGVDLPPGQIGELVVSGPQVIVGYWRNPRADAEAFVGGELRTGDIGFMDADGWFYVIDRKSEIINASGFKVWPNEVERVLRTHPAVVDAAVVGIPDDYRGESVKAFVVVAEMEASEMEASEKDVAEEDSAEMVAPTEQELIDYCRDHLAAFKYPREIELVGELPRTATGKLLRRKLR
ncbi:long-chain fatty acid--CoA ligase [Gordonia oryzae]|uniref:Long-chain fatty acid--CoA ligase n=1 Tax=Gordonia oryzae TaxID=2487349 RepID=A0A3N4GF25_9ACTN|nr:AMP-binding protein [Gordonia oryzae]RPA57661.1 long-chain fatty acid--CoA ligase [Gordonia oryzae]